MAFASSFNVSFRLLEASNRVNRPSIATLPPPRLVAAFARRNNRSIGITSKRKKEALRREVKDFDGGDPFEALFGMLEEDLKNLDDELLGIDDEDEDEDISPEELAKLEKELEAAIGESEELMQLLSLDGDVIDVEGNEGEDEDEDAEDVELELKDWQLKKLAAAAKAGKRRTDIKSLAAELGLDRDIVLELMRIPPDVLLSMSTNSSSSSASQNQNSPVVLEAEYEVLEDAPEEASKAEMKSEDVTQRRISPQKSRKRVQH